MFLNILLEGALLSSTEPQDDSHTRTFVSRSTFSNAEEEGIHVVNELEKIRSETPKNIYGTSSFYHAKLLTQRPGVHTYGNLAIRALIEESYLRNENRE